MRTMVYITAGCPSVRPSVCPIDRQQQRRVGGLLLIALRAGDFDRQLPAPRTSCRSISAAVGRAQQQMRVASCWEPRDEAQYRFVPAEKMHVIMTAGQFIPLQLECFMKSGHLDGLILTCSEREGGRSRCVANREHTSKNFACTPGYCGAICDRCP